MGKASSAKKVARAARAGGRATSGQPRNLAFPGILALVVVLGMSLVVYARADRLSQDTGGVPQLGDHIHLSFGVHACGEFLPALPGFESRIGIHTHSDGVIHVHPFSRLGVGANATLGRYFDDADEFGGFDLDLTDSSVTYLGEEYAEGVTECEGVDDPQLRVAYWDEVTVEGSQPRITTGGFRNLRLDTNGAGITISYGDPDSEIPKPPSSPDLFRLGAIDGGQVPDVTDESELELDEDGNPILPDGIGQVEGEGEGVENPAGVADVEGEGDGDPDGDDGGDATDGDDEDTTTDGP